MNKPIDYLRALTMDIVANAQSGHIGMSLGASTLVNTLYRNILNISPKHPDFPNRDRVVFSAGHCTPLIYSILHLCGYNISIDDLKRFRTNQSDKTPGHPEIFTPGIDCSSGPLGQGIASAVGMAIAEKHLAERFNKDDCTIVDHYTYVIAGEGCLMEGISYESMSLAGQLGLNKLILLYDCNQTTLDSKSCETFNENLEMRAQALGWDVYKVQNIDDPVEITEMIEQAKLSNKPSFVIVPSIIGLYTRYSASNEAHSYLVSKEEAYDFRQNMGLDTSMFSVPASMYRDYANCFTKADKMLELYSQTLLKYKSKYKKEYELFEKFLTNDFDVKVDTSQITMHKGTEIGAQVLNIFAEQMPNIIGGSADLANSTKTIISTSGFINSGKFTNRNLRFGVREFAMAAICNGISLHGGLIPFCSTFLTFSDYLKPAIRMSALMKIPVIYIFTHDSLFVGEDGASHIPVEQIDSLRLIDGLQVYRPCCVNEVVYAFSCATTAKGPSVIILPKNNLANVISKRKNSEKEGVYEIYKGKNPIANIFASGADVNLALEVRDILASHQCEVNIYSILFSNKLFKAENNLLNCVIECGSAYTLNYLLKRENDILINNEHFGKSMFGPRLYYERGFNAQAIAKQILDRYKNFK